MGMLQRFHSHATEIVASQGSADGMRMRSLCGEVEGFTAGGPTDPNHRCHPGSSKVVIHQRTSSPSALTDRVFTLSSLSEQIEL